MTINDVRTDAPLFNRAPADDLQAAVKHLSRASYHYADDTGREWSKASAEMDAASDIIIKHRLCFEAMRHIHTDTSQLVPLADLIDRVLRKLYREQTKTEATS